ncbi:hypothetical protein [Xinfangfangia pollutisoli]|uniref:hypothetical protein n=1 Tax=Xinfangfangia pollutisoli TaxID=2865960 RepID=UPI001CD45AE6|nr:hypothetical protein [Xinfangfangia pollutisoli]
MKIRVSLVRFRLWAPLKSPQKFQDVPVGQRGLHAYSVTLKFQLKRRSVEIEQRLDNSTAAFGEKLRDALDLPDLDQVSDWVRPGAARAAFRSTLTGAETLRPPEPLHPSRRS